MPAVSKGNKSAMFIALVQIHIVVRLCIYILLQVAKKNAEPAFLIHRILLSNIIYTKALAYECRIQKSPCCSVSNALEDAGHIISNGITR